MRNEFEKNEKISLDLKRTESKLLVEEAEQAAAEAAEKAAEAAKKLAETKSLAAEQDKLVKIGELGLEIKRNAYVIYEATDNIEILNKTIQDLTNALAKANSEVSSLENLISSKRAIISSLNEDRAKLGGAIIDIDSKVSVTQQINVSSLSRKHIEATPAKEVSIAKKSAPEKKNKSKK